MEKRYSAKHKTALYKVAQHLRLAKAAHNRGMSSIADCAKCMVDAKKLSKAADDNDMASHLAAANGHFGTAADRLADAQAHLNFALTHFKPEDAPLLVPAGYSRSGNDRPTRSVAGATAIVPSLSDLTEGEVPQLSDAYSEKNAAAAFAKMVRSGQGRHVIGKPQLWGRSSSRH